MQIGTLARRAGTSSSRAPKPGVQAVDLAEHEHLGRAGTGQRSSVEGAANTLLPPGWTSGEPFRPWGAGEPGTSRAIGVPSVGHVVLWMV